MDWYYAEGAVRKGPVTEEQFLDLARNGEIKDHMLVWNESMTDWEPFGRHRDRLGFGHGVPPPIPNAGSSAFCSNCGRAGDLAPIGGRMICAYCKPAVLQQIRETGVSAGRLPYAGFWIRFGAVMIDAVVQGVINAILNVAIVGSRAFKDDADLGAAGLAALLNLAVAIGYEIWFIANKGATPGKMVLGLRVVRPGGGPIGYGLAAGRYVGKFVSGLILGIGYLMAVWDEERRTLHDRICDTRVVRVK